MKKVKIDCNGYTILGDWYEGGVSQVVLLLMGFTSARERQVDMATAILQDTRRSVLVIDYSGHGDRPYQLKDTSPAQHLLEIVKSYDWIKQHNPGARVSVVGTSYGGFLASHLVRYREVEQLVLRAPAIYRQEAFYDQWSKRFDDEESYGNDMDKYRADTTMLNSNIIFSELNFEGSALVVVHERDELIPTTVTNAYTNAFSSDVYIAKGFKHALSQSNLSEKQFEEYETAITSWLNSARG